MRSEKPIHGRLHDRLSGPIPNEKSDKTWGKSIMNRLLGPHKMSTWDHGQNQHFERNVFLNR